MAKTTEPAEITPPTEAQLLAAANVLQEYRAADADALQRAMHLPWPYWTARLQVALEAVVGHIDVDQHRGDQAEQVTP